MAVSEKDKAQAGEHFDFQYYSDSDIAVAVLQAIFTAGLGALFRSGEFASYEWRRKYYESRVVNWYSSDEKESSLVNKANNTVASKNTQPFFCGTRKYTPFLMQEGAFYIPPYVDTLQGRKPRFDAYYELGFPNLVVHKIYAADELIYEAPDETPQNGTFSINSKSYTGQGEIRQGSRFTSLSGLNEKYVTNYVDEELTDKIDSQSLFNGNEWEIDSHAKDIELVLHLPRGFVDNGALQFHYAFTSYYDLGDGVKHYFYFDGLDHTGNDSTISSSRSLAQHELFLTAHVTLTESDYQTFYASGAKAIKVGCGWKCDNSTAIDLMTVKMSYIQTKSFDPNKSSLPAGVLDDGGVAGLVNCKAIDDNNVVHTCNLALNLDIKSDASSDLVEDKQIQCISVLCSGLARTWDEEHEDWTLTKSITRNPAAWALEVLTSSLHPLSKYDDTEIDLESFGAWYEYCEDNDLYFDYIIQENKSKSALLEMICEVGHGVVYTDMVSGKFVCAIDEEKNEVLNTYNAQNIISESYQKEFERRIDGVKVTYNNKNADYKEDTVIIMRDGVTRTNDSVIKELTLDGIVEYQQVAKYVRFLMASWNLRQKTVSISVGSEALMYPLMGKIQLQTDALKVGISSGTIESVVANTTKYTKLILRDAVEFEANKNYGMIVNCFNGTKSTPLAIKVSGTGRTKEINILSDVPITSELIIEPNCVFSFGELDENNQFSKITSSFLIINKSTNENGFTLSLVEYNEYVYNATGSIPEYKSNISETARTSRPQGKVYVTPKELDTAVNVLGDELENGQDLEPGNIYSLSAKAEKDGIALSAIMDTSNLANNIAKLEYQISKDSGTTWSASKELEGISGLYYFDRTNDGYPEYTAFSTWRIRAKAVNIYGNESENWTETTVNADNYGTWTLPAPKIVEPNITDRTVKLQFSLNTRSDNKTQYGNTQYRVEICRPADDGNTFYKPATDKNPYADRDTDVLAYYDEQTQKYYYYPLADPPVEITDFYYSPKETATANVYTLQVITSANEDNYKDGSGYITVNNTWSQTLPLKGQGTNNAIDTLYQFKITATNESGNVSTSVIKNATAHCTNIADFVYANETVKESVVEKLSAISADVGLIQKGGFGNFDNQTNYWALSDLEAADAQTNRKVFEGEFRVGDENEYLAVEIVKENGVPVIDPTTQKPKKKITLKAGNITLTTSGTDFSGGTCFYNSPDNGKRLRVTSQGMIIEQSASASAPYNWDNGVTSIGQVVIDTKGNMIVTNDNSDAIKFGYKVNNSINYRFNQSSANLDENGDNTIKNINCTGGEISSGTESDIKDNGVYSGTITHSLASETDTIVIVSKADKIRIGDNYVGGVTYDDLASTSWGLTQAQVNARIFTEET